MQQHCWSDLSPFMDNDYTDHKKPQKTKQKKKLRVILTRLSWLNWHFATCTPINPLLDLVYTAMHKHSIYNIHRISMQSEVAFMSLYVGGNIPTLYNTHIYDLVKLHKIWTQWNFSGVNMIGWLLWFPPIFPTTNMFMKQHVNNKYNFYNIHVSVNASCAC